MAKEQEKKETKPKKKRAKRETYVLQLTNEDKTELQDLVAIFGPCNSTADAIQWIKDHGDQYNGSVLTIASITPPRTVEIETKSVVKF